MKESIFRQKSIERISSPEKIDDYMKINGISMWLVMGFILLLLIAVIIWGFKGKIEDTVINDQGEAVMVEISPVSLLIGE